MQRAEYIDLIDIIFSWPIAIVVIIIIFRSEISVLLSEFANHIKFITRLSVGNVAAELNRARETLDIAKATADIPSDANDQEHGRSPRPTEGHAISASSNEESRADKGNLYNLKIHLNKSIAMLSVSKRDARFDPTIAIIDAYQTVDNYVIACCDALVTSEDDDDKPHIYKTARTHLLRQNDYDDSIVNHYTALCTIRNAVAHGSVVSEDNAVDWIDQARLFLEIMYEVTRQKLLDDIK